MLHREIFEIWHAVMVILVLFEHFRQILFNFMTLILSSLTQWRRVSIFKGVLVNNICCRMQAFIKQMCGSARKFNAITRTNIKRLFKPPNLLLNLSNIIFGIGFYNFCYFQFFVVISATKRLSTLTSIPLIWPKTLKCIMYIWTATPSKIRSNYSQTHANTI